MLLLLRLRVGREEALKREARQALRAFGSEGKLLAQVCLLNPRWLPRRLGRYSAKYGAYLSTSRGVSRTCLGRVLEVSPNLPPAHPPPRPGRRGSGPACAAWPPPRAADRTAHCVWLQQRGSNLTPNGSTLHKCFHPSPSGSTFHKCFHPSPSGATPHLVVAPFT